MRRLLVLAALLALPAATAQAAYDPSDPAQKAQYDATLPLAERAYQYGMPVLNMDRTFRASTSVNVPNGRGGGPVNLFSPFRKLADARDRTVVAPNADTLYSMAWLDLSHGPLVIHTARPTRRFHVLELVSPWQDNFANIGSPPRSRPDGDTLVTGPRQHIKTPRGMRRISSPYDRAWVIGRTYINGASDLAATRRVMNTYRIVPLRRFDPKHPYAYSPRKPKRADRKQNDAHVPGTGPGEDAATFFDALGDQLKRFPPPARDRPILGELAALGIGPGLHPVAGGKLTDAQVAALRDAVKGGPGKVTSALLRRYLADFDKLNGWLIGRTGSYGTDYELRALVDQYGLGAPQPEVSVYPLTLFDRDRAALTGTKRYVAHFPAGTLPPPVKFFWSITLYDNDGFFVVNPLNRYLRNDRSGLVRNADGSTDVYIQPDQPSNAAQSTNWLPSPQPTAKQTGFRLMIRLYGLSKNGIRGVLDGTGWHAPTVLPCGPDNRTSRGVACAS